MRENILEREPAQELRIFAVWLNQRSTDARAEIDESLLADPRVLQYWDGEGITGKYFAEIDLGGLGYSGFVYDVYYVFGADATWVNEPTPLAGSGGPVLHEGGGFLAALEAQL